MTYPLILYPKTLASFCKQNPIPVALEVSVGSSPVIFFEQEHSESRISIKFYQKVAQFAGFVFLGWGLILTFGAGGSFLPLLLAACAANMCFFIPVEFLYRLFYSVEDSPLPEPVVPIPLLDKNQSDTERLENYLKSLRKFLLGKVITPSGVSIAPVGQSEEAFGKVMSKYFGEDRIKSQLNFPIPNSLNSYSLDLAVCFPEIGLCIDVEIDEPYTRFSGGKVKQTHCVDEHHDRYRNTFFLNGGWIVIRFSERQVVLYPESCCQEIARAIQRVSGISRFVSSFTKTPILSPEPQWTRKMARKMAAAQYRDKYLLV